MFDLVPPLLPLDLLICSNISILTISSRLLLPYLPSRGMSSIVGDTVGISDFQSFLFCVSILGYSYKFSSLLLIATSCVLNLSLSCDGDSNGSSTFSSSYNFLIELFILFSSVLWTYISDRISFFLVTTGLPASSFSDFSPIYFKGKVLGLVLAKLVIVWIEPVFGIISLTL
jgi:hypothetical protein